MNPQSAVRPQQGRLQVEGPVRARAVAPNAAVNGALRAPAARPERRFRGDPSPPVPFHGGAIRRDRGNRVEQSKDVVHCANTAAR
jgi:hypothetical protein